MGQSSDNLLYAVKLHLAAHSTRTSLNQRIIALLMGRDGNHGNVGMGSATLAHKLGPLAVIQVVIGEDQIEAA